MLSAFLLFYLKTINVYVLFVPNRNRKKDRDFKILKKL